MPEPLDDVGGVAIAAQVLGDSAELGKVDLLVLAAADEAFDLGALEHGEGEALADDAVEAVLEGAEAGGDLRIEVEVDPGGDEVVFVL